MLGRDFAPLFEVRRLFARLEPVSADIRTGLCSRGGIPPGKSLVRPETGAAFSAAPADSWQQRPCYPASPAAKPRKVKDYSGRARKPDLRRTAWWRWQDSNELPSGYSDRSESPLVELSKKSHKVTEYGRSSMIGKHGFAIPGDPQFQGVPAGRRAG
jgi:hypothetical protein